MTRARWGVRLIRLLLGLLLCLVALAEGPGGRPPIQAAGAEFRPGRLLVKLKAPLTDVDWERVLAEPGMELVRTIPPLNMALVAVPPGREMEFRGKLLRNPAVKYAELDYIARVQETPNDSGWSQQWNMRIISAPWAWEMSEETNPVIIAVIDTGIDLDHPDLAPKLVPGYDFVNQDTSPDDDHGHGSHVSGIAAAVANNGIGVAGVSWGARLMPLKALDASGEGYYSDVISAMSYAISHGARVINLSLGGPPSQALEDAVNYAHNAGGIVVAAAGNYNMYGNPSVLYPAAYANAIAVAATTSSDQWASFSCYGPEVDLAAPGVSIYSTDRGGYSYRAGTSMATPHVAGLAALLWGTYPALTRDQVRSIMEQTADDVNGGGRDQFLGWGRINAGRAVAAPLVAPRARFPLSLKGSTMPPK